MILLVHSWLLLIIPPRPRLGMSIGQVFHRSIAKSMLLVQVNVYANRRIRLNIISLALKYANDDVVDYLILLLPR